MRLNRLDMNLLVVLDAVLEERNVTRAAERLRLSQPAASNALTRLRRYFDDPLVVSMGRQMVLTPFARELAEPVRNVVLQTRAIAGAKSTFDPSTSTRRFSVNVSDYVALFLMKPAMERLAREAPGITIELDSAAEGVTERFERGTVDMVIAPQPFLASGHPSALLFEETYCCVAWQGNERVGDPISLESYLEAEHVVVNLKIPSHSFFHGYTRKVVATCPNHTLLPHFVVGTQRLATVHVRLARMLAPELGLKVLPLPYDLPPLIEHLQWHRFQGDDAATLWFTRVLSEVGAAL